MTMTFVEILPYILGLGALAYTLRPLLTGDEEPPPHDRDEAPAARLAARRDVIYANIRDLEFEAAMGKLSDADTSELRDEMLRDAALVLEELDVVGKDEDLDSWIEIEARRRRGSVASGPRASGSCPKCAASTASGNEFCEECGERLSRPCGSCGAPIGESAKFCGNCGDAI